MAQWPLIVPCRPCPACLRPDHIWHMACHSLSLRRPLLDADTISKPAWMHLWGRVRLLAASVIASLTRYNLGSTSSLALPDSIEETTSVSLSKAEGPRLSYGAGWRLARGKAIPLSRVNAFRGASHFACGRDLTGHPAAELVVCYNHPVVGIGHRQPVRQ